MDYLSSAISAGPATQLGTVSTRRINFKRRYFGMATATGSPNSDGVGDGLKKEMQKVRLRVVLPRISVISAETIVPFIRLWQI